MEAQLERAAEFAWFAPCCEDDCELLGVADPALASTPGHVRDVILTAERAGFQNILLPSGFNTGVDSWTMAAAVAGQTRTLSLLPAVRVGESHVPMFARAAANLDRIKELTFSDENFAAASCGVSERQGSGLRLRALSDKAGYEASFGE